MNDFVRCNKVSGVYWLKGPVEKLKIKIKLKPPDDILSLPKFEDYTNESNKINIIPDIKEFTFNWQEKTFSSWDIHYYSDIHNCTTDNEIKYHNLITNNEIASSKIFSYIHEDYHLPLPVSKKNNDSKIELFMEYLNLDAVGSIGRAFGGKSDSMSHLLRSRSSLCDDEMWMAMHLVFDYSDPNEENYIKQETILLSIYHNRTQNFLIITPDSNDLETNPYTIDGSVPVDFKYAINVDTGEVGGSEELEILLTRLYSKWQKKHKSLVEFVMPPLGKVHYMVTIELLSTEGFYMDNLYIEYTMKLSEGVQCNDALHGRTHKSEAASDICNFGHLIELFLETDSTEHPPIKIFLEVISIDWRGNHRTEGYTYRSIQLRPGIQEMGMICIRPEEKNRGSDRRFFIGGCNLLKDLDVLSLGDGQNSSFTNTATGKVHIRSSILSQCGWDAVPAAPSALLRGAEAALHSYRRAKERLAAATRDITTTGDV